MDEERLDHGEADEIEHAVIDGEQDRVDRTVQSARGIDRRRAANGERAHRPLAGEDAAVVPLAAAVDAAARGEHAIDPALEDRGQPEPPERKLQDQRVAPEQLVHLRLEVRREAVVGGGMGLFGLLTVVAGVADGREVAAVRHRVEAHGVEIRQDDLVPGGRQRFRRRARQGAVEALRLGVGMNDEDAHGAPVRSGSLFRFRAQGAGIGGRAPDRYATNPYGTLRKRRPYRLHDHCASFDKRRMRNDLGGTKAGSHPLMSAFARCRRNFFSRQFEGAWTGGMDRCTDLGAGVAATVDRSLIRGLDTDRTMGSSRGCLALSTSMGLKPLQDEAEGSPDLRPAPRLLHRRYVGWCLGSPLLRFFYQASSLWGLWSCGYRACDIHQIHRPDATSALARRLRGGGAGDGPDEAERLAGDRRHRHRREL